MIETPQTRLRAPAVACFGEALWDILPEGIFVGGAPLNVAYHLSRHGARVQLLTALGRYFLGDELHARIRGWGIDDRHVARLASRPTGTVRASLDRRGAATYDIRRNVAWDRIPLRSGLARGPAPAALVFGTLALRGTANRAALVRLGAAWPGTWRVLDLNLRPPFGQPAVVRFALGQAQFLKLNTDELGQLAGRAMRTPRACERAAREVAARHALARICVTAGADGAGLLWDGGWHWERGRRIVVRDTVGAGDAFLAALLAGLLARHQPPRVALAHACRMGEFVAARAGATPPYTVDARGRPRAWANA